MLVDFQASIEVKEAEVETLRETLNTTSQELQTAITALDNATTPDIEKLETACEGLIATDCCHVSECNN